MPLFHDFSPTMSGDDYMSIHVSRALMCLRASGRYLPPDALSAQDTESLAGRVVDPSGAAVAGARVWIVEGLALAGVAETVAESLTDSAGRFTIVLPAASSRPDSKARALHGSIDVTDPPQA